MRAHQGLLPFANFTSLPSLQLLNAAWRKPARSPNLSLRMRTMGIRSEEGAECRVSKRCACLWMAKTHSSILALLASAFCLKSSTLAA